MFESCLSQNLGLVEVQDQIAAVEYCTNILGIACESKVGVYGWSYGGYLSAMCLCRAPHIFKVAVAGKIVF